MLLLFVRNGNGGFWNNGIKNLRFEHFYRKGNQAESNKEKPKPMFTIEPLKQCTQKKIQHNTYKWELFTWKITRSILFIFGYSIQHRALFLFCTVCFFVIYWDILANCKSIDERLINCWFFFFFHFLFFPLFSIHIQKPCIRCCSMK